jgi:NAD(P)-dependent dehydrogenase (short-subunit alcohol dehydrogenase family)
MDIHTCYDLSGKTVLVTGANGGLGTQLVKCLSGAGARVIMASRNPQKLNVVAEPLKDVSVLQMDVADRVSVTQAFKTLAVKNEKIDVCINNAAIMKLTPVFDGDLNDDFEEIM